MKKPINFSQKIKNLAYKILSKEYFIYTGIFFCIMMALYLTMVFAGMANTPKFTYAEF